MEQELKNTLIGVFVGIIIGFGLFFFTQSHLNLENQKHDKEQIADNMEQLLEFSRLPHQPFDKELNDMTIGEIQFAYNMYSIPRGMGAVNNINSPARQLLEILSYDICYKDLSKYTESNYLKEDVIFDIDDKQIKISQEKAILCLLENGEIQ